MTSRAMLVLSLIVFAISIGIWGIYASPVFIAINYSSSLAERLFVWKKEVPASMMRDDFVFFEYEPIPGGLYFKKGDRLIRKIAGLPGDLVVFSTGLHLVCPSQTKDNLDTCKEFKREAADRNNKKFPIPFQPEDKTASEKLVIPEGQLYVYGTNSRSYDSRYFGLISKAQIIGKLSPIF